MNRPDRREAFVLGHDERKVTFKEDTKMERCGTFRIAREDHTVGNLLRMQLLRDERVTFAGYIHRHPLENDIYVKVQTVKHFKPEEAFNEACKALCNEARGLKDLFERQVENYKQEGEMAR